ncbi:phosphoethanolamine Nmethyltransferase putative [Clostridium sp. CAG:628]|nr:phosphoethanolamine Nmethyltransferase putative [Clostridium sp. CAG:628]
MNKELWLFDYKQAEAYEKFSKSEDINNLIQKYLKEEYDLSNKIILEIGAGSGKFTGFLSDRSKKVYAVEKIESLLLINKEKHKSKNNVEFILSDIKDVKLEKNSIDYVFAGWSLTSMRDIYDQVFANLYQILKPNGKIIIVENGGQDEFCKLLGIEEFTEQMKNEYKKMNFKEKATLDTTIKFANEEVFYGAFPNYKKTVLKTLNIKHKVIIMEKNIGGKENENNRI